MTTPDRLRTSVVVITKDRPHHIVNLLRSLTRQTQTPDEVLIVIDGASRASYLEVISEYGSQLPLRMVVEDTPGIPAARNRGIQEMTGDILLFTDDDCVADPRWVENMVKPFYQNPYIGVVGGEILSERYAGSLVEEFLMSESVMRLGRDSAEGEA